MNNEERKRALRKRTKRFAGDVVRFFCNLDRRRDEVKILSKQMVRAGTSVGANYREASRARSDADFISKVEICVQEADETQYWLELLNENCGISNKLTQPIWDEANELISIFVTMSVNTKKRISNSK
ncbi:four helix bundle protein [Coraliomargarita sinensis]|uniref:Four helix bundle protein n=1 Tax=Coraliomargarita sinensis TaxID=2174842 RepID=A0A317ZHA5_9BACT|nr:four helix bundle protein [Coraliomargarita sinensis]PXA03687.1 four helix bundle protein [Coraliomargarita sinensis]